MTVIPVLVVAEHLLDEEACQVLRDALLQPLVAPLLGGDETAVELVGDGVRRDRPRFIHLGEFNCFFEFVSLKYIERYFRVSNKV